MQIRTITPRMILDSRGNPTVEVDVTLVSRARGRAAVPSGASTGEREAVELRDGTADFHGLGVEKAIAHITSVLAPAVVDDEIAAPKDLDNTLIKIDGSKHKSALGANAILAISLAFAKAAAEESAQPLFEYIARISGNTEKLSVPTPMFNIINGGKHAAKSTDIQEFMIVPTGIATYPKQLQAGSEVFHTLKKLLQSDGVSTAVGDEGGFTLPGGRHNTDAIELIIQAIQQSGYQPGKQIGIALDVAASELYDGSQYLLKADEKRCSAKQLIEYYSNVVRKYPVISIEDGLEQNDWDGWHTMNHELGDKTMLVGDDLLVTNTAYIQKAIDGEACNAVLIKPNQIGTLTETIEAVQLAHKHGMTTIMSHRSGETEDTTIADLAVGLGCKFIKSGSLSRSERLAKYNQLLRINEQL